MGQLPPVIPEDGGKTLPIPEGDEGDESCHLKTTMYGTKVCVTPKEVNPETCLKWK